jgi:hypothetical protein
MDCFHTSRLARLLTAEGGERIDTRGAASGNITSEQSDTHEYKGDTQEGQGIGGPHAVEKSGH